MPSVSEPYLSHCWESPILQVASASTLISRSPLVNAQIGLKNPYIKSEHVSIQVGKLPCQRRTISQFQIRTELDLDPWGLDGLDAQHRICIWLNSFLYQLAQNCIAQHAADLCKTMQENRHQDATGAHACVGKKHSQRPDQGK